ncbi:site-specific integrase [Seonamhaeicola sp. ML3]|uniref:site-specific integrase n=1 Tax=Seonamhaeicola sp. ML3 TaxID=2937786 RepID=UPI00200F3435|nr:site-specific integrase [Seonamhaeicola sp. ML3]
MEISKLNILFLLQKNRINKEGKCPIRCRITHLGKRKVFSTGLFINPKHWKSNQQSAHPPDTYYYINTQLSLIKQKLNQAFLFLQVNYLEFNVIDIYSHYQGKQTTAEVTLLETYDQHNNKMKKLIGIDFNETSWSRYIENKRKVKAYVNKAYKKSDIKLRDLDLKFIKGLEYYFKTDLGLSQSTINRSLQRVRKIINYAISENLLNSDPFIMYKPTKYKLKLTYLDAQELARLEEHKFAQIRLEQVRDMFVFCCYTGLAYAEMNALSREHLIKGFDGNTWIQMYRKKTNSQVSVPLLPKALDILARYKEERDNKKLLPLISNQKLNSYLKEIAEVVGIEKRLTHHIARKTFATTILLYNDVPMEIVSELLGHSKLEVTQRHYAKVVQNKVSEEINRLRLKLD